MKAYLILNILTLIVLIYPRKEKNSFHFLYFILFVVLFESILAETWKSVFKSNHIPYGIFALICSYYYCFAYIKQGILRKINTQYFSYVWFLITILIIYIFSDNFFILLSKMYLLNFTIACILGVIYLNSKIYSESSFDNIYEDPLLPFTFGILIFYSSSFPLLLFLETLISSGILLRTYSSFLNFSNIFLSLGYLGAAICIKKGASSTISS